MFDAFEWLKHARQPILLLQLSVQQRYVKDMVLHSPHQAKNHRWQIYYTTLGFEEQLHLLLFDLAFVLVHIPSNHYIKHHVQCPPMHTWFVQQLLGPNEHCLFVQNTLRCTLIKTFELLLRCLASFYLL